MNFDDAIRAHSSWKMKLSSYLRKPDGSLRPADVEVDYRCDLGKWIQSARGKLATLPELALLKREHARFHRAAADIVRRADEGQNVAEEVALGAKSEFAGASTAVVSALMSVKTKTARSDSSLNCSA